MSRKKLHITADAGDNSIVLSDGLCAALDIFRGNVVHVFVFKIKDTGEYAFMRVKEEFAQQTECPIVSYNPKYDVYGFMSSLPTVNRIFYDMGIEEEKATMSVRKRQIPSGGHIYVIKHRDDNRNKARRTVERAE
jgi:hypothetical protein